MHFLPNQKKTLQEKKELEERITSLSHFVKGRNFETLQLRERQLRKEQLGNMRAELETLNELIGFWKERW
jgi:hypothetical protein